MWMGLFIKLILIIMWKSKEANRTEALCLGVNGKQQVDNMRDPTYQSEN